jgi:uncharacterized Ntn-hydrolase superfamily protein
VTISLVGRCARTGELGAIISSSSPAVAARCPRVRAGVGAVSSQNITDPRLGPALLDRLAAGDDAAAAMRAVVEGAGGAAAFRQLLAIDAAGRTAVHSGEGTLGRAATREGRDCAAAGNLLANLDVPDAMVAAFEADPSLPLAERLVRALEGGVSAGGEEGPVHSAGLLVARDVEWPVVDLRADWDDAPVQALRRAWEVYEPQVDDYVRRALDPQAAPSFGVPGDP